MGVIERQQLMVVVFVIVIFVGLKRLEWGQFWRWLDIVVRHRSHR
jgi:hypothetical protein